WDNSNGNFFRVAQFRAEFGILLRLNEFAQQMRLEAVNPDRLLWNNSNGNFFRIAQFRAEFGILLPLSEFVQQMRLEAVNPDRLLWNNSNGNFFRIAQFRAEFGNRGFICRRFPRKARGRFATPTYPESSGRCCLPIANSYRKGAGFVVGVFPKVFGSGSAFKCYLLGAGVRSFLSVYQLFSYNFIIILNPHLPNHVAQIYFVFLQVGKPKTAHKGG
ncbi:MAG: hypothetical protein PHR62_09710, partial [Paludibacter sp.]|nr:hypothetical protein [Paludibacter sp.]